MLWVEMGRQCWDDMEFMTGLYNIEKYLMFAKQIITEVSFKFLLLVYLKKVYFQPIFQKCTLAGF